jgi:hypothetical protein
MVGSELVSSADQDIIASAGDLHHIIGYQAVPALHQIEDALALADSRPADEEQANPIDVGQRPMQRRARSKCFFDDRLDAAVELGSLQLTAQDRNSLHPGELQQLRRRILALGYEDTGQVEAEKIRE